MFISGIRTADSAGVRADGKLVWGGKSLRGEVGRGSKALRIWMRSGRLNVCRLRFEHCKLRLRVDEKMVIVAVCLHAVSVKG